MNDIIGLRIIAEEYKSLVEALLANKYYAAQKSKNAWKSLIDRYTKEIEECNTLEIPEEHKENKMKHLENERRKFRDAMKSHYSEESLLLPEKALSEMQAKQLNLTQDALEKIGIAAVVKDRRIEFLKKDVVLLRLPLKIDSKEKEG